MGGPPMAGRPSRAAPVGVALGIGCGQCGVARLARHCSGQRAWTTIGMPPRGRSVTRGVMPTRWPGFGVIFQCRDV
jgi:hypothetical protein